MSIGYQKDIRVIFISTLEENRIKKLEKSRHKIALEILKDYNASMILWGETNIRRKDGNTKITVKTFLTIDPETISRNLSLLTT